jgi:hypothetical protein
MTFTLCIKTYFIPSKKKEWESSWNEEVLDRLSYLTFNYYINEKQSALMQETQDVYSNFSLFGGNRKKPQYQVLARKTPDWNIGKFNQKK